MRKEGIEQSRNKGKKPPTEIKKKKKEMNARKIDGRHKKNIKGK